MTALLLAAFVAYVTLWSGPVEHRLDRRRPHARCARHDHPPSAGRTCCCGEVTTRRETVDA